MSIPALGTGTWAMSVDELMTYGAALGVQTWPTVLDLAASQKVESDCVTTDHETSGATIDPGEPTLATLLTQLGRPDVQFEIRVVGAEPTRACVAITADASVIAVREGLTVRLQTLSAGIDAVAGAIVALMGDGVAADMRPARAPIADLVERLDAAAVVEDYVDALYAAGVHHRDAVTVGSALSSCTGHAEIVVARSVDGSTTVSPAAVVVLETDVGRIVASPCPSPDRVLWTTFAPGTRQRLRQALALLMETLDDGP